MSSVQCSSCGRMTDYLVDDGICQKCFDKKKDEANK